MLQASETSERRQATREFKFLVDPDRATRIVAWSRAHLESDPYGTGPFADEYRTTSLYFDSAALDVYHRRGSFKRSKYRIRRYDDATVVFLERKMRTPAMLVKRRTVIPFGDVERLSMGTSDPAWEGYWFHRRISARCVRPTCQVSYRRVARVAMTDSGVARLTCDRDIRAEAARGFTFAADHGVDVMGGRWIVEMKFRSTLPAVFKRALEEFSLEPLVVSKYRLSLEAIAPDSEHAAAGVGEAQPSVRRVDA